MHLSSRKHGVKILLTSNNLEQLHKLHIVCNTMYKTCRHNMQLNNLKSSWFYGDYTHQSSLFLVNALFCIFDRSQSWLHTLKRLFDLINWLRTKLTWTAM